VFVADSTAANAVTVTQLSGIVHGSRPGTFNSGYTAKVTAGSETNYIKNIENVNVQIWNDANSNGQKDWGSEVTFGKNINLAMNVNEIKLDPNDSTKVQGGATLASQMHYAWANGGLGADTFSLSDISSATQTLMNTNQRGLWVRLGAGDDTATGSGFGDNFDMGSGTNYVDGGANAGTTPVGRQGSGHAGRVRGGLDGGQRGDGDATERHRPREQTWHVQQWLHRQGHMRAARPTTSRTSRTSTSRSGTMPTAMAKRTGAAESITFGKNINLALNVNEIKLGPQLPPRYKVEQRWPARCTMRGRMGRQGADTFSI
jgi:hypothetical protein